MNKLEIALLDVLDDSQLDDYLEISSNHEIRQDIDEIRRNAANTTPAGRVLESLRQLLKQHEYTVELDFGHFSQNQIPEKEKDV